DEETGSTVSRAKLIELTQGLDGVLVFEPGLPDGSVVTSEAGVRWLKLSVAGKASHAGLEPDRGVNACLELADKVLKFSQLSDPAHGLYVNPDVIQGGSTPNVICDQAAAKIDIRFRENNQYQLLRAQLDQLLLQPVIFNPILNLAPTLALEELAS